MNLIKKSIFLVMCFGAFTANTSTKSSESIIQELLKEYQKKYNATKADSTIDGIVQDVLKMCGITRPVIVLQSPETAKSYTLSQPSRHSQEFIMLGIKNQGLDQIISTIYHEIGHITHGDVQISAVQRNRRLFYKTIATSLITGIGSTLGFKKLISANLFGSISAGGLMTGITFIGAALYSKYQHSIHEYNADVFAYQNLIKHNKVHIAITQISDYIFKHSLYVKHGTSALPAFLTGYPTPIQRAQNGLDILRSHGFIISDLIKNLPENLDQGIKEHFPAQIKEFFPHLA